MSITIPSRWDSRTHETMPTWSQSLRSGWHILLLSRKRHLPSGPSGERFARPGKTLLGSDSHTPTAGGVGSLAMGAGGLDVAVAMGGGAYYLAAPKVIDVHLMGNLQPWSTAKDVALKGTADPEHKGKRGASSPSIPAMA